jgi:hypothetical protein
MCGFRPQKHRLVKTQAASTNRSCRERFVATAVEKGAGLPQCLMDIGPRLAAAVSFATWLTGLFAKVPGPIGWRRGEHFLENLKKPIVTAP